MSPNSLCKTNRENHHGICTTLEVVTENYYQENTAEHGGFELCTTLEGSVHHRRFRNQGWKVTPNDLMVFNAREPHTELCSKNPTVRKLRTVIIEENFIQNLVADVGICGGEVLFSDSIIKASPRLRELISILFSFKATPHSSRFIFESLATEITLELVANCKHSHSEKVQSFLGTGHFPSHFSKAKAVMRELACESDVSLDAVAKLMGLSKFHFVRSFKRYVGISPIQYLNQLKIDFAKQRLTSEKRPITEVAMDLGYSDLSTFNKSFKKTVGLAPSQYRQQFGY